MQQRCHEIANSERFQSFILSVILITAFVMGLETVPEMRDEFGDFFTIWFFASQTIFLFEIAVRLLAYWPSLPRFFKEFWNSFDFAVIVLSLLPAVGGFAVIARLLRVVRVVRVISVSDKLRGFVNRLHEGVDEFAYANLIVIVLAYIFSITGNYLFAELSAEHWGTLSRSFVSIFYLVLLQDVASFLEPLRRSAPLSILYFVALYLSFFGLIFCSLVAAVSQSVRRRDD